MTARRERRGALHEKVVHVVAVLAPDLDRVPVAFGGDQRGARTLALDESVRQERRPVHDVRDVTGGDARGGEKLLNALLDCLLRLFGRREDLGDLECGARRVHEHEIGERPTDIGTDPIARHPVFPFGRFPGIP